MYQLPATLRARMEQWLLRPFVEKNLQGADVALSLGGGLSRILRSMEIPEDRIVESPNGVGREWLVSEATSRSSPLTFAFVGRYERRKGVEELQKAISQIERTNDFRFHIIGPVPEHLRINIPQVTYWGLIKEEDEIKSILRESDVLVCPSYSEGMPTVILEAMASGLAVIATNVGAVEAVVRSENGWLISPDDEEELREALKEAIATPSAVLKQKKRRSLEIVRREFLWEVVARRTIMGIEDVITGKKRQKVSA